jgi:hypothetical protein
MASVIKTTCDVCGFEELGSKGGYPDISRMVIKIGRPMQETVLVHEVRDLCPFCQSRIKDAVTRALEPLATEKTS